MTNLRTQMIERIDEVIPTCIFHGSWAPQMAERIADAVLSVLSAAPSPAGDEDEVERVATALWRHEAERAAPESTIRARTLEGFRQSGDANRALWLGRARAAISAMRPAPKLTEEDRATVEEIRKRITAIRDAMLDRRGPTLGDLANAEQALSLIDKLTNQEPTHER